MPQAKKKREAPHVIAKEIFDTPAEIAKREIFSYRYDVIDPEFEDLMARIGDYGAKKYGDFNWTKSRLTGNQSPLVHALYHINQYRQNKPYDHEEIGSEPNIHLAAAAFNLMMEYWYTVHINGGPWSIDK